MAETTARIETLAGTAIAGLVALSLIGGAASAQENTAPENTAQENTGVSDTDSAAFLREILAAVEGGENAAPLDASIADTVHQAGETAAGAVTSDDADAAIAALEGAIEAITDARPFTVRRAILVDGDVETFGEAEERAGNAFRADETVTLYVEPTGYDFAGQEGDYTVELSGDYALLSPSEQILLVGQADFARFDFEAESKTQDLFLTISYTLRDLRPGTYTIVTRLNDLNGGDATSFRTPIEIVDGEADATPTAPTTDAPAETTGETTGDTTSETSAN